MNEKITKESINNRLISENRNIEMIGEYLGSLKHSIFRCYHGHEWSATPNKIINYKSGCASCHYDNENIKNKRMFIEKISSIGVELIGEYINSKTLSIFKCLNGHEWSEMPSHISECKTCSDKRLRRLSTEVINERLMNGNRDIVMVGEYVNAHTKSFFRCSNGHEFLSEPNNVIRGTGCPTCTPGGFNQNMPAHVYILSFETFIKYGITNRLSIRLDEYKKYGIYIVEATRHYDNGSLAKDTETRIKQTLGGSYVDKSLLSSGHTETLPISMLGDVTKILFE
jgi:hypothetical protein